MSKVKLQTPLFKSRSIIIPILGETAFDQDGCIETESSIAQQLLAIPELSLSIISGKIAEKSVETIVPPVEENNTPATNNVDSSSNTNEISNETLREELNAKNLASLKEMIKDYPKEQIKELKKKEDIVNFIINAVNATN
jgi:hypothetical protein